MMHLTDLLKRPQITGNRAQRTYGTGSVMGSIKGRKNTFKKVEGRLLKVNYKPEGDNIIVITAMVR